MSEDDITRELESLRFKAEDLYKICESLNNITGMHKLLRRCKADLQFLNRIQPNGCQLSESQLTGSHFAHLQGIHQAVEALPGVSEVLRRFRILGIENPVHVDVICNHGRTWVKVVARNSKGLLLGRSGHTALSNQGEQLLELAQLHPHNFAIPQIAFLFFHDVPEKLHKDLNEIGITVWEYSTLTKKNEEQSNSLSSAVNDPPGDEAESSVSDCETVKPNHEINTENISTNLEGSEGLVFGMRSFCRDDCVCQQYFKQETITLAELSDVDPTIHAVGRVNLDISTLVALVSNVCHGHCDLIFQSKRMTQQAAEERCQPVLPKLLKFLSGKKLFVCETAHQDFNTILSTLGGPQEQDRARVLMQYVTIVPDCPSERSLKLRSTSTMNSRAKIIFGSGDFLEAVTTTGNQGVPRSASQSKTDFVVFLHSPRSLTEQKEHTAVAL